MSKSQLTKKNYGFRRYFVVGLIVLLATFTFLLRNSFLGYSIELFINSKLATKGSLSYQFERFEFNEGKLRFHNVRLHSSQGDDVDVKIDYLDVGLRFNLHDFEIDPTLDIGCAHVKYTHNSAEVITSFKHLQKFIKHSKINVSKGTLEFNQSQLRPLYFTYQTGLGEEPTSILSIYKGETQQKNSQIDITLTNLNKELFSYIDLHRVEAAWLYDLLDYFNQASSIPWQIDGGTLGGHIQCYINRDGKISRGDYRLKLKEIKGHDRLNKAVIGLDSASLKAIYPFNTQTQNAKKTAFFNLMLQGELKNFVWSLENVAKVDVSGTIRHNTPSKSGVDITGNITTFGKTSSLQIQGKPYIDESKSSEFGLQLTIGNKKRASRVDTKLSKVGPDKLRVITTLRDLDVNHINIARDVLASQLPQFAGLKLHRGVFEGNLLCEFEGLNVKRVSFRHLKANNLHCEWQEHKIVGFCSELVGMVDFDPVKNNIDAWQLKIASGDITHVRQDGQPVSLSDLQVDVSSELDTFSYSKMTGRWKNHLFDVHFWGKKNHPDANFKIHTHSHLVKELVTGIKSDIDESSRLMVGGNIRREMNYWRVAVAVEGEKDLIEAECKLTDFESVKELENLHAFFTKHAHGGWIRGKNIGQELYSIPLNMIDNGQTDVDGRFSIEGTFDGGSLNCKIASDQLTVKNTAVDVASKVARSKVLNGQLFYSFLDQKYHFEGDFNHMMFNIQDWNLRFDASSGKVVANNKEVKVTDISTSSCGVVLQGEVQLLLSDQSQQLAITVSNLKGRVPQLINFAKHFPGFKAPMVDVDGDVTIAKEGFSFIYDFAKPLIEPKWHLAIAVANGKSTFSGGTKAQNCSATIDFFSEHEQYHIQNLTGDLIFPHSMGKTFTLNIEDMKYHVQEQQYYAIQGTIEDDALTYTRFKGKVKVGDTIQFQFEPRSLMILDNPVTLHALNLDKSLNLLDCQCEVDFDLNDTLLFQELYSDVVGKTHPVLHYLATQHVQGHVHSHIDYKQADDQLKVMIHSPKIRSGEKEIGALDINFDKKGEAIKINKVALGDLNIEADTISHHAELINISNLLAKFPEKTYLFHSGQIDLRDLSLLLNFEDLMLSTSDQLISGIVQNNFPNLLKESKTDIKLSGQWRFEKGRLGLYVDIAADHITDENLSIRTQQPVFFYYSKLTDVELRQLDLMVTHPKKDQVYLHFACEQMQVDLTPSSVHYKGLKVTVSPEMIQLMKDAELVPNLRDKLLEVEKRIPLFESWENVIELTGEAMMSKQSWYLKGHLKKGYYWIAENSWNLKRIDFELYDKSLKLGLETECLNETFALEGVVAFDPSHHFNFSIFRPKDEVTAEQKLKVIGCIDDRQHIVLKSVKGQLYNTDVHIMQKYDFSDDKYLVLSGGLKLPVERVGRELPSVVANTIEKLNVTSDLTVHGDIVIDKEHLDQSYFEGTMTSRNIKLGDQIFRNLLSKIYIDSYKAKISDVRLSDEAGLITVDKVTVGLSKNLPLEIDNIKASDIRPSIVYKVDKGRGKLRPFVVKTLNIPNISGEMTSPKDLKGRGSLTFVNTFKRGSNLLDFPRDFISRIGFDVGLLIPVRGHVDFKLDKSKIILEQLRDAYSDGDRSHFFFSPKQTNFIDMNGNLVVDVRMKQYVLFKITQPFTLSIRGNLMEPRYSLK